ncbi:MAG TPA: hypothetical protein VF150_09780, partial [Thermoanaerobaculia bacterium]
GSERPAAGPAPAPTDHAGLAFLLHVVAELDLVRELLAGDPGGRLPARPLRWTLHALARRLAPVEPADPAALLFCGLGPDAEPPSVAAEPPDEDEARRLEELAGRIRERLRERLDDPRPASEVVAEVTARSGTVVADPGWIEVRLPLSGISVPVRRAGLDLDPGWIPWLGVVVKVTYHA